MIKITLVVAAGFGICAAAALADGTDTGKPYHLEPIAPLAPYDSSHCLRETGTRIETVSSKDTPCIATNGRVYETSDINATGALTLGEVLARDPSISVTHR